MGRAPWLSSVLPVWAPEPVLTGTVVVRHHHLDPPVVLSIVPENQSAPWDPLLGDALRDLGFAPVDERGCDLPVLNGLVGYQTGRYLAVRDRYCGPLFHVAHDREHRWPRAAAAGRRLGLVFRLAPAGRTQPAPLALGGTIGLAGARRAWGLGCRPADRDA